MAEFMTGLKRTHYCGELRSTDIGKEVVVCVGYSANAIWGS